MFEAVGADEDDAIGHDALIEQPFDLSTGERPFVGFRGAGNDFRLDARRCGPRVTAVEADDGGEVLPDRAGVTKVCPQRETGHGPGRLAVAVPEVLVPVAEEVDAPPGRVSQEREE